MKLRQQAKRISAMRAKRPKFWTTQELAWFDETIGWLDDWLRVTKFTRKPEGAASSPWTPSQFY